MDLSDSNNSGHRNNSVTEFQSYQKVVSENFNLRLRCYNLIQELHAINEKNKHSNGDQTEYANLLSEYDAVCEENRTLKRTNAALVKYNETATQSVSNKLEEIRNIIDDFKMSMDENNFERLQVAFGNLLDCNFKNIGEISALKRKTVEISTQMNDVITSHNEHIRTTLQEKVNEKIKIIQSSFQQNLDESLQYNRAYLVNNRINEDESEAGDGNISSANNNENCVAVMHSVQDEICPMRNEDPKSVCNECNSLKYLLDKNLEDYTAFTVKFVEMEQEKQKLANKLADCDEKIRELEEKAARSDNENAGTTTSNQEFKTMMVNVFKKTEVSKQEKRKLKAYYCDEISLLNKKNYKLTERILQANKKAEDVANSFIAMWNFTGIKNEENANLVYDLKQLISKSDKDTDHLLHVLDVFVQSVSIHVRKMVMELQNSRKKTGEFGQLTDYLRNANSIISQVHSGVDEVKYKLHEISFANSINTSVNTVNMSITSNTAACIPTRDAKQDASLLSDSSRLVLDADSDINTVMESLKSFGNNLKGLVKKMTVIDLDKTLPKHFESSEEEDHSERGNLADLPYCNLEEHTLYLKRIEELEGRTLEMKKDIDRVLEDYEESEDRNKELKVKVQNQDEELHQYKSEIENLTLDCQQLSNKISKLECDCGHLNSLVQSKEHIINEQVSQLNDLTASFYNVSMSNKNCHEYVRKLYTLLCGPINDEDNEALENINSLQSNSAMEKMTSTIGELYQTSEKYHLMVHQQTTENQQQSFFEDNEASNRESSHDYSRSSYHGSAERGPSRGTSSVLREMNTSQSQSMSSRGTSNVHRELNTSKNQSRHASINQENIENGPSRGTSSVHRELNTSKNQSRNFDNMNEFRKENVKLLEEVKDLRKQIDTLMCVLHGYKVSIPKMHTYIESYQKQSEMLKVYINKALRYMPDDLKKEFQETSANFEAKK